MPIEIKELIIRASVEEKASAEAKSQQQKESVDQTRLVEECVAQVLEILRREKER